MKSGQVMKTLNSCLALYNYTVTEDDFNDYSEESHQRVSRGRDT